MRRNGFRRLERLETRAKQVAAAHPAQYTICFIEPANKRVTSTLAWENGSTSGRTWIGRETVRNSGRSYSGYLPILDIIRELSKNAEC